jgi:hypothetical protein
MDDWPERRKFVINPNQQGGEVADSSPEEDAAILWNRLVWSVPRDGVWYGVPAPKNCALELMPPDALRDYADTKIGPNLQAILRFGATGVELLVRHDPGDWNPYGD